MELAPSNMESGGTIAGETYGATRQMAPKGCGHLGMRRQSATIGLIWKVRSEACAVLGISPFWRLLPLARLSLWFLTAGRARSVTEQRGWRGCHGHGLP